ncbi:MAG: ABC transporter permease, partial [Promethearchaeota archaeon]
TVDDVMGCDIRIFTANTPRTFEEELKDIDGVEDVMGISHLNIQLWHEDKNQWIGHGFIATDWDKSIRAHIIDTETIEDHMKATKIVEPSEMTLKKMMEDLSEEKNSMIITKKEAEFFNLDVDDEIIAKFTVGISYPTLSDLLNDNRENAYENTVTMNMKVIAIVEHFQGFASFGILGQPEDTYHIYISWETYQDIATYDLPGGNTDIIIRKKPQSGEENVDLYAADWFNFSNVYPLLESISNIDYYTTRMDYFSPSYDPTFGFKYDNITDYFEYFNLASSVVGIRTNSTNNLVDDSYFGQHKLLEKSETYPGSTMEELLNNKDNVTVITESLFNLMKWIQPSFDIGSNIKLFPQQFNSNPDNIEIIPPDICSIQLKNGTSQGNPGAFAESDNGNMTFKSIFDGKRNSLEFNITINMGAYINITHRFINFYSITFESRANSTVDQLDLEVFNYYTNKFDKLGDINYPIEKNNTFIFNQYYPLLSYLNKSNFDLKLRIVGYNSTFSNNFSLDIDWIKFDVNSSLYEIDPTTWLNYTVIGVIEDPVLYKTERVNWNADSELIYDITETQNAYYINYENARSQIYPTKSGSTINGSNDMITHVFIHCDNVYNIEKSASLLRNALGSNWTILDLKTGAPEIPNTLKFRLSVFDWYFWIDEGEDDEEVLEDIIEYLEDNGYYVRVAYTKSYVITIFRSMLDLITMIMYGVLVFAIVIAMIGLTLHCLVSTMARRREIGMLRSLGLSKKGVIRTISGETLVVAFFGTILGIITGLLTGILMASHLPETVFLAVSLTIPWLIISLLIIITLITAVISSRYPSRWAANINIVDAVRTL